MSTNLFPIATGALVRAGIRWANSVPNSVTTQIHSKLMPTPSTVYILSRGERGEGGSILGVYSTLDLALQFAAAERCKADRNDGPWTLLGPQYWVDRSEVDWIQVTTHEVVQPASEIPEQLKIRAERLARHHGVRIQPSDRAGCFDLYWVDGAHAFAVSYSDIIRLIELN